MSTEGDICSVYKLKIYNVENLVDGFFTIQKICVENKFIMLKTY